MALVAHIGEPFVFQVLFVDLVNVPIAATGVTIDLFRFDDLTGARIDIVSSQLMTPAVPVETGRFFHIETVLTTLLDGGVLYAEMSGTDPGSGARVLETLELSLVDPLRTPGGLQTNFF